MALSFILYPKAFNSCSETKLHTNVLSNILIYTIQILWEGFDGLQGPVLVGTCFYIKRVAFYGSFIQDGNLIFLLNRMLFFSPVSLLFVGGGELYTRRLTNI